MQRFECHHEKAFTLVELAIVMTIIGLLIGGILKGQELLENARVTSTIAQVKSYNAAVTAFRDIYGGLPGDLTNAGNRIPGCTLKCTLAETGIGDGRIGGGGQDAPFMEVSGASAWDSTTQYNDPIAEFALCWAHLLKANLISGINDTALRPEAYEAAWGETNPSAKIGGGFLVGSSFGGAMIVSGVSDATGTEGVLLAISSAALDDFSPSWGFRTDVGQNVLTPARAGQIDRKMDDGAPATGTVQAYGTATSCFADGGGDAYIYLESVASKDCGLVFRIQG